MERFQKGRKAAEEFIGRSLLSEQAKKRYHALLKDRLAAVSD